MADSLSKFSGAALLDDLTGLYNRRYFYLRLDEEIKRAQRYGRPFCLLLMDLDNFKMINDSFGHLKGDKVLAQFAKLLKESVRETDIPCRYGGDEFALILPETDRESSLKVAKKIMNKLKNTYFGDDMPLKLSISIGIASYPEDGSTPEELFNASDHALYHAKREGGNRIKLGKRTEAIGKAAILYLSPKFTGRDKELERIKRKFLDALKRETGVIAISGEAGVGKTRLAQEFLKIASLLGAEILKGKCYDFTKGIPYQPIKEALATYSEIDPLEVYTIIEEMPVLIRSEVLKILPFLDITRLRLRPDQVRSEREPEDKWRLFSGIKELLEGLERKRPLVIFFDDIHWADDASLELLSFLIRSIKDKRILFLFTFRDEEREKPSLKNFLKSLTKEENYEEIQLERLRKRDVSKILKSILGVTVPEELVSYIYAETEGNPFFVIEYIRGMADDGAISIKDRKIVSFDTSKKRIPPSIREVILSRIEPLRDITKRILRIAATIGEEVEFDVLKAVSGINEGFLFDVLDELLKLKILKEEVRLGVEKYCFTHGKIRDVIYEEMPASLKRALHRKIAKVLEEMASDPEAIVEELAHHYSEAREWKKAVHYLKMSAKKAEKLYAYENALAHYEKALELIPPEEKAEQLELLKSMIPILHIVSNRKREKELLDRALQMVSRGDNNYTYFMRLKMEYLISTGCYRDARKLGERVLKIEESRGNKREVAETLRLLGEAYYQQAYYDKALEAFESASEIWQELQDTQNYSQTLVEIGKILHRKGFPEKAMENLKKALEVLEAIDDRRGMAHIYCELGIILLDISQYEQALSYFNKAHQLYTEMGDKEGQARALHLEGTVTIDLSNFRDALAKLEAALRIRQEIGDKKGMAASLGNIALIYQSLGDDAKALENYRAAEKLSEEIGDRDTLQIILNNMGTLYLCEGKVEEALKVLHRAKKVAEEVEDKASLSTILINLGNIAWQNGELNKAEEYYLDALKIKTAIKEKESVVTIQSNLCSLYIDKGMLAKALESSRKALRLSRNIKSKFSLTSALLTNSFLKSILGKNKDALRYALEARRISTETGAILEYTNSLIMLSETYQRLGQPEKAWNCIKEAEETIQSMENPQITVIFLQTRAYLYEKAKQYDLARADLEKALAIAHEKGLKSQFPPILSHLAQIELMAGNKEKAAELAQKAAKTAKKQNSYIVYLKALLVLKKAQRRPSKKLLEQINSALNYITEGLSEKDKASFISSLEIE